MVFCLFLILFPFTEIVSLFYHRQRNWLWVKQRVSYKKRELLTLREHLVLWWGTFCDGVRVVMGYVLWWGTCCDGVRFVMGSRVASIFNLLCCVLYFVCLYSQYRIQCCNWPFRFLYRINDIKPNLWMINSVYVFSFTFSPLYDIIIDRTHNNFKVKFPIYEFSITIFRSFVKHVP